MPVIMVGCGLGALQVIIALYLLTPMGVLQMIAVCGLAAGALSTVECAMPKRGLLLSSLITALLLCLLLPQQWLALRMSDYKALSQTLHISGTTVKEQLSSPFGMLTLVDSLRVPLRIAPGMSLDSRATPPTQYGLFIDGDGPTALTSFDGDITSLDYLDYLTSALPYHVGQPERVLVLGMGGGSDLLQAHRLGAETIDAVELNPQLVELFQQRYADFTGWPYLQQKSRLHIGEARGFLATSQQRYDLIQISLLDSAAASSAGLYALSENYLYTREGLAEYLAHLEQGGLLAITRWVKLPPRDGLKLFATAVETLRHMGISNPEEHLQMIRGWSTSTLLVKREPFNEQEIERLHAFSRARSFDLAYYPGIDPSEVNRHNILSEPYFYQAAMALLGDESEQFYQHYKFDIRPTSDNRPYFFNFFKWSTLPELLTIYRQGGLSLLELGYPLLILTLVQALVISVVLILLPLAFRRQQRKWAGSGYSWRTLFFFTAIGLAFLFIEIAFIHKFILFLTHPTIAVTTVLCGFLLFSGLGSLFSDRLLEVEHPRPLLPVVLAIALLTLTYLWLLPQLFAWLAALAVPLKVVISLLLIAPLAFCMGMPFPVGLIQVAKQAPQLVPWAWGINSCASLISAILASVLAIHFGFSWPLLIAALLYISVGMMELRRNG